MLNSKNLNKLVDEALAIEVEAAKEAGAIGYMARVLTQATLPHKRVEGSQFKRSNGVFSLSVLAPEEVGLPYGTIPRLLLSWLTTEAVRTKTPELILGHTLSEFMAQLGLVPTGGRWGTINRLRDQMQRLFSSTVSCRYTKEDTVAGIGLNIAKEYCLWWHPKHLKQTPLWQSTVTLSKDFFDEIIDRPVPIDMRALNALKRSPLALDIYCWLTYRMSYVKKKTLIPWGALEAQFGSDYDKTKYFKRKFLDQLRAVLVVYPEAKIEDGGNNIILLPSSTHIQKQVNPQKTIAHQPTKEITKPIQSKKYHFKYESYKFSTIIKIIEQELSDKERKGLLKEFSDYLHRRKLSNLHYVKNNLIDSEITLKRHLYEFITSRWHHLLATVQPFDEFVKTQI